MTQPTKRPPWSALWGSALWEALYEAPFLGWWLRHAQAIRMAYQVEKSTKHRPQLDREAAEFLPGALAVMERPPAPLGRILVWFIAVVFGLSLTWSIIGTVDIHATAIGRVVPSGKVKIVQPSEQGVVRAILVQEGEQVTAGQALLELDTTIASADLARLNAELNRALFDLARLTALIESRAPVWPTSNNPGTEALQASQEAMLSSQIAEWNARQLSLDEQVREAQSAIASISSNIAGIETRLPLVKEREQQLRTLVEKGLYAKSEWLQVKEQVVALEGNLATEFHEQKKYQAALQRTKSDQVAWQSEIRTRYQSERADAQNTIAVLTEERIKAADRNRLLTLVAPTDGIVDSIAVSTLGGVVTPAQEVIKLVPLDATLEIEAQLENKDVGFVELGQHAEVKIEAFNFIKYGTIPATVSRLGADSTVDEQTGAFLYSVRAKLLNDYIIAGQRKIPLVPGMSATLEIKTGKRRIIEFLLAPIVEKTSNALNER